MPNMPNGPAKKAWVVKTRADRAAVNEQDEKARWNDAVNKAANKYKWGAGVTGKLKK